jgi:hypothetical protein
MKSAEESAHYRCMEHRATEGFWRAYQALPPEIRSRADKQFALPPEFCLQRSLSNFQFLVSSFYFPHSLGYTAKIKFQKAA